MNTAQFISIFNSGGNPLGPFQERVEADGGTVEGLDNMLAKYDASASWQLIPSAVKAGTAYAQVPNTSVGDLTVTRASSGTFTNSAGVVQTAASNVLRTDYRNADGTLSATGRYLLEPQRTNSIRNSSMVGAVAGTPGTLPTNWVNGQIAGLSRQIVGVGTENGLPYIDFRFFGTTNTSDGIRVDFETGTSIAAVTGQTWAYSLYSKLISGTIPTISFTFFERNSGGGGVTSGSVAFAPTSTLTRFSATRTLSGGATVAFVQTSLSIAAANATAYDFTIRIAAPQMEPGAYATTWVPTTTAAVTRLADVSEKTGIGSLIGQAQGTLFIEGSSFNFLGTGIGERISVTDGSFSNRLNIDFQSGGSVQLVGNNSITAQNGTISAFGVISANNRFKVAIAYDGTNSRLYVNGTAYTTIVGTIPTFSGQLVKFEFNQGNGARPFYGRINQARLYTTRLTNAQLAELTTL